MFTKFPALNMMGFWALAIMNCHIFLCSLGKLIHSAEYKSFAIWVLWNKPILISKLAGQKATEEHEFWRGFKLFYMLIKPSSERLKPSFRKIEPAENDFFKLLTSDWIQEPNRQETNQYHAISRRAIDMVPMWLAFSTVPCK